MNETCVHHKNHKSLTISLVFEYSIIGLRTYFCQLLEVRHIYHATPCIIVLNINIYTNARTMNLYRQRPDDDLSRNTVFLKLIFLS